MSSYGGQTEYLYQNLCLLVKRCDLKCLALT